jgi:protocatechuate 3,4-dioxygenase beta subunit
MGHFTRREFLRTLSGIAMALAGRHARGDVPVTASRPGLSGEVRLTPELTEGPYYIDLERIRRDITEGKPGVPLRLKIRVAEGKSGQALEGAAVDVWHCDAQGVYSGFSAHGPPGGPQGAGPGGSPPMEDDDAFFGMPGPPPGGPGGFGPDHPHQPDNALTFMRGVQITGADGVTEIDTIYPGWYMGRTTHIHVRVHVGGRAADGRYRGGHICHTGQVFLPENITDEVYRFPAYAKNEDGRMKLADDGIFRQGGSSTVSLRPIDPARPAVGYIADVLLIVDSSGTPGRV